MSTNSEAVDDTGELLSEEDFAQSFDKTDLPGGSLAVLADGRLAAYGLVAAGALLTASQVGAVLGEGDQLLDGVEGVVGEDEVVPREAGLDAARHRRVVHREPARSTVALTARPSGVSWTSRLN